jgi:hypothetical protein
MMCMGQLTNLEFEELKTDISTKLELVHQIERRAKYIGRNIKQQKKNLKNSGQTDPLFAIIIKQELEKVKQERGQYRLELEHERIWKRKEEEYEWSILELS